MARKMCNICKALSWGMQQALSIDLSSHVFCCQARVLVMNYYYCTEELDASHYLSLVCWFKANPPPRNGQLPNLYYQ